MNTSISPNNNMYGIALVLVIFGAMLIAMANGWKDTAGWLLFLGICVTFMWEWKQ
jgi:hypothetical protein